MLLSFQVDFGEQVIFANELDINIVLEFIVQRAVVSAEWIWLRDGDATRQFIARANFEAEIVIVNPPRSFFVDFDAVKLPDLNPAVLIVGVFHDERGANDFPMVVVWHRAMP